MKYLFLVLLLSGCATQKASVDLVVNVIPEGTERIVIERAPRCNNFIGQQIDC